MWLGALCVLYGGGVDKEHRSVSCRQGSVDAHTDAVIPPVTGLLCLRRQLLAAVVWGG